MVADALVSVGVVISGVIIAWTGWNAVDPIVSIINALVILIATWDLLSGSLRLLIDGMPEGIELDEVQKSMEQIEHVKEVHHLHIWAISTTDNALTDHVVGEHLDHMDATKIQLKELLKEKGIGHSTLEFETVETPCHEHCCEDSHS